MVVNLGLGDHKMLSLSVFVNIRFPKDVFRLSYTFADSCFSYLIAKWKARAFLGNSISCVVEEGER